MKSLWIPTSSSGDFSGLHVLVICVCKGSVSFSRGCSCVLETRGGVLTHGILLGWCLVWSPGLVATKQPAWVQMCCHVPRGTKSSSYAIKKYVRELDAHSMLVPVSFDIFLKVQEFSYPTILNKKTLQNCKKNPKTLLNSSLKKTWALFSFLSNSAFTSLMWQTDFFLFFCFFLFSWEGS